MSTVTAEQQPISGARASSPSDASRVGARSAVGERIAVVSPHLDDAILSVGAAIAGWTRAGVGVEVVTVFAGDPESGAPASSWDHSSGFATAGQAARARREEDARACEVLGATPVWLPFEGQESSRRASDVRVYRAVLDALAGANTILLPGFPLSHPITLHSHDFCSNETCLRPGLGSMSSSLTRSREASPA